MISIVLLKIQFAIDDILPFTIPVAMYLCGNETYGVVLKMWVVMLAAGGFFFGLVGFHAGHHHHHVTHDGDQLR